MNSQTLPVWFRPYGYKLYAWAFHCNLDEMLDPDLTHYASLGEFFSRELKPGVRPLADAPLISPCDGTVLHLGRINGGQVEQVKGLTYSLDSLLGFNKHAASLDRVEYHDEHQFCLADEEQFASLNGIDYSLGDLLGDRNKQRKSVRSYLLGWVKGSWRYVKHTASSLDPRGLARRNQTSTPPELDEESDPGDAGIPTSDTSENLQRYANVAYELGSEAIPSFMHGQAISAEKLRPGHRLYFCVIYLAPGDYHRFHSPAPWVVEMRRHFRGELYSVSPYVANRLPNLFLLNERVALLGRWRYGFFSMIPIGATNVGSIRINFDRNLRTNVRGHRNLTGTYSEATYNAASRILGGQPLGPGEEMGGFLLGSTIVLVFEAPDNFHFDAKPGEKVKMGQLLGEFGEHHDTSRSQTEKTN
ncbi:phosphatidylserine decarboxylase [Malassezia psittaci]|uniref:phosphatidylserine decarboxylase n=1 Tax=Malassezia psittaci TaxID=1821823 RepID=A0AAF0F7F6_9BASI|nr:phosphatidylserine decarboxylase [Malassezia psittaci]